MSAPTPATSTVALPSSTSSSTAAVVAPAAAAAPATPATAAASSAAAFSSASLYVGDLKPEVTESQLFELFKAVGTVASIRVCRDATTRRSLGYAYVNFHNSTDAENALDQLNYSLIDGKPCRIMRSQRDPSRRKTGAGNLFIKNLNKSITNQHLLDTFSKFGNILSCKVETDDAGVSKGYGYVHFENEGDARQAIEQVNGKQIMDKVVFVGPFLSRRERINQLGATKYTNVYVKNLEPTVTKEDLERIFSKYGKITSCVVILDKDGVSRCFGFANFATHEEAVAAVEGLNNTKLTGSEKQLYVARAQKKWERSRELKQQFESRSRSEAGGNTVNLYVRNLDDSIDDEELRKIFGAFGTITSAKVMRDGEKGTSKGFGFVCFSAPEESMRAIQEMNSTLVRSKPLYVALAQKKEQRRQQLDQIHRRPEYLSFPPPPYAFGQFGYPGAYSMRALYPPPMMGAQQRAPYQPGRPLGPPNQYRPPYPSPYGYPPYSGFISTPYRGQRTLPGPRPRTLGPQGGPAGVQQRMPPQPGYQQRRGPVYQQQFVAQLAQAQAQAQVQVQAAPVVPQTQPVAPIVQATPAAQQVVAPPPVDAGVAEPVPGPLTVDQIAGLSAEDFKAEVGERLYSIVSSLYPQQKSGKITGMLLESMDLRELNGLLGNVEALRPKIDEANSVLEEHQRKQQAAQAAQAQGDAPL